MASVTLTAQNFDQIATGEGITLSFEEKVELWATVRQALPSNVAVIAGSGPIGTRLTMRFFYFVSGVEYPDLCILHASTLVSGASAIRLAGFFGNDWSVERSS